MTKSSTAICAFKGNLSKEEEEDFHDLFAELDQLDPFDIKKEELAAQLAALLSYADLTRSEFAAISGWKKSRVTNVLSGDANPTFKTLWEFARCLGYEADLNFRTPNAVAVKQPWQLNQLIYHDHYVHNNNQKAPYITVQTVQEVITDFKNGTHESFYYCIKPKLKDITHAWNKLETLNSSSIPPLSIQLVEIKEQK
jgi:transcriptional regulator with XRE-family HTH domain